MKELVSKGIIDGRELITPNEFTLHVYRRITSIKLHGDLLGKVDLSHNNLTVLLIPENLKELYCFDNNIKELKLTENIKDIYSDIINIHGDHTNKKINMRI